MTVALGRAPGSRSGRQIDRLSAFVARHREIALYGAIFALALGLRLWDLGARPFQYDESRHVYYAWRLFTLQDEPGRAVYEHVPALHGPFQYFATAAIFRLFGDNDVTARLLYALFGCGLAMLPYFLRDRLGATGGLLAAAMLAISPTLLYFSRFARDDILVAAAMLGLAVAIWRYLHEQRPAYLYAAAVCIMLGVLTKEVALVTTAIFLAYLDVELATQLFTQVRASRRLNGAQVLLAWLMLLTTGWLIALLWPVLGRVRGRWLPSTLPPAGHLLVVIGTLLLLPLGPAVERLPFVGDKGFYQDVPGGENRLFWTTFLSFAFVSACVGLLWNWRRWLACAAIVYVPFVLLYTTGFTNLAGFKSGMWGSVDFWMRLQTGSPGGNQPEYYYLILASVYEFLPLVFALGGALYYAFRGTRQQQLMCGAVLLAVLTLLLLRGGDWRIQASFLLVLGTVLVLSIDSFTKFLLFWTLATLFALSVAGERMPWLEVHLAVPLALLAAKVLNDLFVSVPRTFSLNGSSEQAEGSATNMQRLMPLLYAAELSLAAAAFFQLSGPASPLSIVAWLLALGAAAVTVRAALQLSWRAAGQVAAGALVAAMLAFTVRATITASFQQGAVNGYPRELFIYAQAAPGVPALRDQIDALAGSSSCRPTIVLSGAGFWPWPWYLRNYGYQVVSSAGTFAPPAGAVVLIDVASQARMDPYRAQYLDPIRYTHLWSFPQPYGGLRATSFLADAVRGRYLSTWRSYFIDRTLPGEVGAYSTLAFFPKPANTSPPASDCPRKPLATPSQVIDADTRTFLDWASSNRPAGLPDDGERLLHLPAGDMFLQDWEVTSAKLAVGGGRAVWCGIARQGTRAVWSAFISRSASSLPGTELVPTQQGTPADIDTARSVLRAACDWADATRSPTGAAPAPSP